MLIGLASACVVLAASRIGLCDEQTMEWDSRDIVKSELPL